MQDRNYFPSQRPGLVNKFPGRKSPKEQKQIRLVLVFVFGATLFLVIAATAYREIPRIWQEFNQPRIAVSERISPTVPSPTPVFENEKISITEMLVPLRGTYAVYFEQLEGGANFGINQEEILTAASLIKMPVLITLFREAEAGRIDLDSVYKLQAADKRGGAGALQYKSVGYEITYSQMAKLMGEQSDNTAFNVVANTLGAEKIQATIDALGMKNTSFGENLTTPQDMGILFRKLYSERIVSNKSRDEILTFITKTIWEERIPAGVPEGIVVSHKIGSEIGVVSDAGIVFGPKPFILVIMSQEVNEIEAKKALPEITKKIYEMTQEVN